jgi:hypothetical protein
MRHGLRRSVKSSSFISEDTIQPTCADIGLLNKVAFPVHDAAPNALQRLVKKLQRLLSRQTFHFGPQKWQDLGLQICAVFFSKVKASDCTQRKRSCLKHSKANLAVSIYRKKYIVNWDYHPTSRMEPM